MDILIVDLIADNGLYVCLYGLAWKPLNLLPPNPFSNMYFYVHYDNDIEKQYIYPTAEITLSLLQGKWSQQLEV